MIDTIILQLQQTTWIEWLGTLTGLAGVALSIKEKVLAWPCFILCYGLYGYLAFTASLRAAMMLNICFIPISLYGWWQWTRPTTASTETKDEGHETPVAIAEMSLKLKLLTAAISAIGTLVIGFMISHFIKGAWPYLDAFATTLSFLAQWMLSRKYIENWVLWFTADVAFILLWGIQGYWVAVSMFLCFTILAASGFLAWRKELASRAA